MGKGEDMGRGDDKGEGSLDATLPPYEHLTPVTPASGATKQVQQQSGTAPGLQRSQHAAAQSRWSPDPQLLSPGRHTTGVYQMLKRPEGNIPQCLEDIQWGL